MKILITTFIISLLVSLPARADITDDVLTELATAGIQFAYATPAKNLTILKTKATDEVVDAFVASGRLDDLLGVNVEVVTLADTLERNMAERARDERLRDRQN